MPYNKTKMNLEVKAVVDGIGDINEKVCRFLVYSL